MGAGRDCDARHTVLEMSTTTGPCGACAHFGTEDVPEKLLAAGYGRCGFKDTWCYQSRLAACAFDPSRWKAARSEAVDKSAQPVNNLPDEIDFG